jgi:hypothetical protein
MRSPAALATRRTNRRQLPQPRAGVVPRHRAELLTHDGRLVRQIVSEERPQILGQPPAIDGREVGRRHDQLQEGISSRLARPDARARGRPPHSHRGARPLFAAHKRTEQREAGDALRRPQRDLLRDEAAHRMPDQMEAADLLGVGDGQGVGGHRLDAERRGPRLRKADAAVVEGHQIEARAELVDLRAPALAHHADPLDQQHRRTDPTAEIGDPGAGSLKGWHASKLARRSWVRVGAPSKIVRRRPTVLSRSTCGERPASRGSRCRWSRRASPRCGPGSIWRCGR